MDFLNKSYEQLIDLFRSMTVGARITSALLLAVVVISLAYLLTARGGGPEVDLMHGMPVPANYLPAMQAAFNKAGLSDYEVRGTQILVPRGTTAAYMAALVDGNALPPNFGAALSGLQGALDAGGVFESERQRQRRVQVATQEMLSQIISSMQGLESAYVLFGTDQRGGLARDTLKTASVAVQPLGGNQLGGECVSKIRFLVAGAFAMDPKNVTVADLSGGGLVYQDEDGGSPTNNLYASLTRYWEENYRTKIRNALSYIPNLSVEPTVVLDSERMSRIRRTQLDSKTVTVSATEESRTRTRDGGGPAGRVGYTAQAANAPQTLAASSSGSREQEEETTSRVQNVPSGTEEERESVGLTPTRVAVSVGIPSRYVEKVWRERNPTPPDQDPQTPDQTALDALFQEISGRVRSHVATLLPPVTGMTDLTELVQVSRFDSLPGEPIPTPDAAQRALTWLGEYWMTLGMLGLAGFSLLMLRSMIRATPASPQSPAPGNSHPREPRRDAGEEEPEDAPRLRRFQSHGRSLRDELTELVQEDPDTAANILKSWINSAT
jgi:flagellar M-ring protein FliF